MAETADVRVLVTGSRGWRDRVMVRDVLDTIGYKYGFDRLVIVYGDCLTGADAYADEWAREHAYLGVRPERHPADWARYGRAAGPRRNAEMARLGATLCVAFNLDHSPGTTGTVKLAREAGITTYEHSP